MCSNPLLKANVITFATALLSLARCSESKSCQTETEAKHLMDVIYERDSAENFIESVRDCSEKMVNYEKSFLIALLWEQIVEKDWVKLVLKFYNDLSLERQSDLFSLLGNLLNEDL